MLARRVEVLFTAADYDRLRQFARARGVTVGEAVREAVARYVLAGRHRAALLGEFDMDWPDLAVLEDELARDLVRDLEAR